MDVDPKVMARLERRVRIELYTELLKECDGPQPLLNGRRLLDLSDVKEWLAVKMRASFSGTP